jgi:serine/threonine-protein kinase HipA
VEIGYCFIYLPGEASATRLGVLELDQRGARHLEGRFTYSPTFLGHPKRFEIDPRLPLGSAPHSFGHGDALFGAFSDAMPDAWGRHVIENKLRKLEASLMEYLVHASANRIGALEIVPRPDQVREGPRHGLKDLKSLMRAASLLEAGKPLPPALMALLDPGPSAGGARPKETLFDAGREWIAKFPSRDDKIDIGRLEFAALEMARRAGIPVPPTRLETIAGKSVLLIERFDRVPAAGGIFTRRHFMSALTVAGLGEADSRHLSYPGLAEILRQRGGKHFKRDCRDLFCRMVFNLFVGNDDDHGKNHAFMIDAGGRLELTPVYDIVPKARIGQAYYLAIGLGEEGRLGTVKNALSRAEVFGIKRAEAIALMAKVRRVVMRFKAFLEAAGMDKIAIERVSRAFLPEEIDHGRERGVPAMALRS